MEDNLKILKGEYLSNHLLDHTKILKLSSDVQTTCYKFLNEDDQQILKGEYLSNHLLDKTQILKWNS